MSDSGSKADELNVDVGAYIGTKALLSSAPDQEARALGRFESWSHELRQAQAYHTDDSVSASHLCTSRPTDSKVMTHESRNACLPTDFAPGLIDSLV